MATITLKYQKNQSHEIRVEDFKIEKVNNKWTVKEEAHTTSFFLEEYKEAIEMVNAIIALCKGKKEEEDRKESANRESESINNRILFVGQRGTGKTSAMTSFARALNNAELDDKNVFKHLPLIDPSNFDNNTNILLTVITMMFSEAKKMMKNDKNDEDIISMREDLLRKFDEVFKSLKAITGSDKPTYTLEGLNEKSRALQMRTGMHCLVKSYIEFYNKVNRTHLSHLVLLIDDIDMTVSHVPEMLEQLRKYLDLNNLLILMSANLGQLYNEMREHYSQAFKETLNDRNQALSIDVEDLANKYLLKLFPTSRRVQVEHGVKQLLDTVLEINTGRNDSYYTKLGNVEGTIYGIRKLDNGRCRGMLDSNVVVECKYDPTQDHSSKGKLQNVILSLIWQKTRLIFTAKGSENVLHPIIPTNLRELMQFLDMLTSLDDVKYCGQPEEQGKPKKNLKLFWDKHAYENCKTNVAKFKKYFLKNYIPGHLSVEEELVFDNIPIDITEINKHLINSINVIGNQHKKRLMSREVGLDMIERNADNINIDRDIYTMVSPNDPKFIKANKISDIFNQPSNYSYGDLLLMIDKYETYFESADDRKFTDAIKIYYSILLFETMFFAKKEVDYKKPDNPFLDDLIIPIQQLIGGTVYYPNYFEIIKDKYFNQKGPSFDAKRAFYHKLPIGKRGKVGEDYPFYAILYYGDIRPDRYDTKHIYDTTFDNDANIDGTDYVTFDILSILSNMLNPWHTYFRANNKVKDDSDEWKNKIEGHEGSQETSWRNFCEIQPAKDEKGEVKVDEKSIFIPNSILPFYSVDMMLNYLKESYEVSNVIDSNAYQGTNYYKYKEEIIKGKKLLFSNTKIDIEQLLSKITYEMDDENKRHLNQYVVILNEALKKKNEYPNKKPSYFQFDDITNNYLNEVISIVLNNYPESQKERDTLIKELHKYSTPSEIFKHLVESLWDNKMTEICIRSDIQEKVRKKESVDDYYIKLWKKTERLLDIADDDAILIYRDIFDKAAEKFIIETHPDKVHGKQQN